MPRPRFDACAASSQRAGHSRGRAPRGRARRGRPSARQARRRQASSSPAAAGPIRSARPSLSTSPTRGRSAAPSALAVPPGKFRGPSCGAIGGASSRKASATAERSRKPTTMPVAVSGSESRRGRRSTGEPEPDRAAPGRAESIVAGQFAAAFGWRDDVQRLDVPAHREPAAPVESKGRQSHA